MLNQEKSGRKGLAQQPSTSGLNEVPLNPEMFLYDIDSARRELIFVPMTRDTYALSSFHDEAIVTAPGNPLRIDLDVLMDSRQATAVLEVARPVVFLFHTGYCGSTLLARALDQPGICLAYREPLAFSRIARGRLRLPGAATRQQEQWQLFSRLVVALLSRTFHPDEIALIKPKSEDNYRLSDSLALPSGQPARGIFLYNDLATFVCASLKSGSRRRGLHVNQSWVTRFSEASGLLGAAQPSTDAEIAAYQWVWQMVNYLDAVDSSAGANLRSLPSATFFDQPTVVLTAAAAFFKFKVSPGQLDAVVSGELFTTHAKHALRGGRVGRFLHRTGLYERLHRLLPARKYDRLNRRTEIAELRQRFAVEIAEAQAWVDKVTSVRPLPAELPQPLLVPESLSP